MSEGPDPGASRSLGDLLGAAYTAPRASMRAILGMALDEGERLLMVATAIVVRAIGFAVTTRSGAEEAGRSIFGQYTMVAVGGILEYALMSFLLFRIGRAFKGTADGAASRSAVAWWLLATAPLQAMQAMAFSRADTGFGAMILLLTGAMTFWLFACYAAEAHRFRSVPSVFGAMIGISLLLGIVLSPFLAGLAPS